MDEKFVKERVQNSVDGVMEQSIPNARFVDVARFGVGDIECLVWGMDVFFQYQIII